MCKSCGNPAFSHTIEFAEISRNPKINQAVDSFHKELSAAVNRLEVGVFQAIGLNAGVREFSESDLTFEALSNEQQINLDAAIERFMTEMAGHDRDRLGFVDADTGDGLIQVWDRHAYRLGASEGADITGAEAASILGARNESGVKRMLDEAFTRLSDNGKLRLEGVRDDIQSVLLSGLDAGLSPIDIARGLTSQFDQYRDWEFERLARTEVAFAQNAGLMDEFSASGFKSAIDEEPPFHPNCLCAVTIDTETKTIVYDISATACEICQAYKGTERVFVAERKDALPDDVIRLSQSQYIEMTERMKDGDRYRRHLRGEISRIAKLIGEGDTIKFAIDNIKSTAKLEKVLDELKSRWNEKLPPQGRAAISTDFSATPQVVDPETKRIYDGLGVTAEQVEKYKEK